MAEWNKVKLSDVCVPKIGIQTGPFGSQLHQEDYVDDGTPIITVEHLGNNRITHQNLPRVSDSDKERLKKYLLRKGDIVFSRVGSVDRRALIRENEDGWMFSGRCLRIRLDETKADPAFIAFQFGTESFKEYIRSIAVGATMPSINTKILSDIEIVLPPLIEQKAIASVLSALDDKIENNRKMNETLEATSRALFKNWFVDFDPVKAKAKNRRPVGLDNDIASLFPSSFTNSEFGQIPEGWSVGKLGDIATNPRIGVQPKDVLLDTPYIGLEHMPRGSISLNEWEGAGKVTSTKSAVQKGDFLFGKLRPYFHKVGVSPVTGIVSTDILIIRSKSDDHYSYVLMLISNTQFVDYTNQTSQGTKMPRTNWDDISKYKIVLPNEKLLSVYNNLTRPMLRRINLNIHESKNLECTRDVLLPLLVSGKLRVYDIPKGINS